MKRLLLALTVVVSSCSPRMAGPLAEQAGPLATDTPIVAEIDLTAVTNDRLQVQIDPGVFTQSEVLYRLPRVVQGTYAVSDFGSFTEDFKAYDYAGAEMAIDREDPDTWRIADASRLDRITYLVNDTYDIEQTGTSTPFSPSGTNIAPDVYLLNLHAFVGYFEGMDDADYEIHVRAPAEMVHSSALPLAETTTEGAAETDVYRADRYFEVTDNPMMYGELDKASFSLTDIDVTLTVYSPTGAHTAAELKPTLERMMTAQRDYLGELETTSTYDIFLYLAGEGADQPTGMGALEHHRSTVMTSRESQPADALADGLVHTISHEFFHIVQPLTVHSEDIHYFDYHSPTFSKHLWFYEGQTEYFANHFQVYEGLVSPETFYQRMAEKIDGAAGFYEPMSFTEMSEHVIEPPYEANYANVYQKGALIGMCNDIMIRANSGGERGLIKMMEELQYKYGIERPFEDDSFIDEFTAFTYPDVGAFLNEHVVGSTPIDYAECLEPVGISAREVEERSTLFVLPKPNGGMRAYITNRTSDQHIYFPYGPLNSTLEALGVQGGDMLKSFNGTDYTLANIVGLVQASATLTPETEIQLVVERDGEEIELNGTFGAPMGTVTVIEEMPDATPEQIALRNAWLGQ